MGKMLAVFAVVLAVAGALAATLAVESYSITPSTLKPGEEGAVTFSVKNVVPSASATTSPLEDVQVFFGGTSTGMEFKSGSPFIVGTVDSGGSALVSIPFRILPAARGGVMTASFFISQKDKSDLKTVNAIIRVSNPPILTLSSDRQTVLSTDVISLTIKNNGGVASKATLRLLDGSNFSFVGTSQIYVGEVAGLATVEVPLDSRNVGEGVSGVPFVLSYQQEGGDTVNETKTLYVAVKKEKADVVFTQDGAIVAARDNVLRLKVRNTGRALQDFKIYWEDEKLKAKESKQVRLGSLATGEEKAVEIKVFADAQPGVRNAAVVLKWVEDDVEKEEATAAQIFVNSDADAAVFIDAKPAPIVVGGEHTLSVLVSNVGSYKIQNVEVSLPESELFEILNAQKSQYIGGLEADDFSTVQYKVRVKKGEAGTYPMAVGVKYKDQSGVWVEKNATSQIIIRPADDAGKKDGNGSTVFLLLGIAVAAGGAYWWFRLRRQQPKQAAK